MFSWDLDSLYSLRIDWSRSGEWAAEPTLANLRRLHETGHLVLARLPPRSAAGDEAVNFLRIYDTAKEMIYACLRIFSTQRNFKKAAKYALLVIHREYEGWCWVGTSVETSFNIKTCRISLVSYRQPRVAWKPTDNLVMSEYGFAGGRPRKPYMSIFDCHGALLMSIMIKTCSYGDAPSSRSEAVGAAWVYLSCRKRE